MLPALDIAGSVGTFRAITYTFQANVTNNRLDLTLVPITESAKINALRVTALDVVTPTPTITPGGPTATRTATATATPQVVQTSTPTRTATAVVPARRHRIDPSIASLPR